MVTWHHLQVVVKTRGYCNHIATLIVSCRKKNNHASIAKQKKIQLLYVGLHAKLECCLLLLSIGKH